MLLCNIIVWRFLYEFSFVDFDTYQEKLRRTTPPDTENTDRQLTSNSADGTDSTTVSLSRAEYDALITRANLYERLVHFFDQWIVFVWKCLLDFFKYYVGQVMNNVYTFNIHMIVYFYIQCLPW